MLTFQGHAEFDGVVNLETVKVFGRPIWSEEVLEKALESTRGEDDSMWAAGIMLRFFLENEDVFEDEKVEGEYVEEDVLAML